MTQTVAEMDTAGQLAASRRPVAPQAAQAKQPVGDDAEVEAALAELKLKLAQARKAHDAAAADRQYWQDNAALTAERERQRQLVGHAQQVLDAWGRGNANRALLRYPMPDHLVDMDRLQHHSWSYRTVLDDDPRHGYCR